MKKQLCWALAPLLIFAAACSSDQAGSAEEPERGASQSVESDEQNKGEAEEITEETETVEEEQSSDKKQEVEKAAAEAAAQKRYKLNPANWTLQPVDSQDESKVVLLTIDDAPDQHSLKMAASLKELGAQAIFFVNGHFIDTEEEQKTLKEIHNMGFSIGNHTMTHPNLKGLSEEQQREEIVGLNDKIESIIGERPKFFRAPFGSNTEYSKKLAEEEGMLLMNWTYGYDWEKDYQNKKALTDIMVNSPYLTDGANLLMHDREWTNEALPDIVAGLRDKGYGIIDPEQIQVPERAAQ
ncbi:polysaccharide deacetylase family protein [Bacillus lacus]|uniref:Polysaccharide deacetylase family protein n=1 Tax=Metabacillus lacus TaxID=1983721 RepID=A0A7X2IY85_9BACI|nr:polysaccharide deacetylase family protein [Metabacillus lacus]MRX71667.1 polysaccharide deacetylase family protein [Metabacillus lacus]